METTTTKLASGEKFPAMSWDAVGGGTVDPAGASGWRVLVVYRGRHCPICKSYLDTLESLRGDFDAAGIAVSAVSADPRERAEAQAAECGWKFPIGCGLEVDEMRRLGLYVSEPRSPQETDRPFSEPGLYAVNPAGETQIIDISNAPFARPELKSVLKGLQFVMSKDYPIRGTA